MPAAESQIEEMVHRETRAWDARDADELLRIFHPDTVWPWPPDPDAHDPALWVMELGRYDPARWRRAWQQLFDTHALVHNRRRIVRIVVSREGDGALAVVDVDTLWRDAAGRDFPWKGRAGKVYTKVGGEWKLIMHTGLLDYGRSQAAC
jgi:ketosteroid isomerase-like protein